LEIPRVLDADTGGAQSLQHLIPLSDHVIFSERGLKDYVGDLPLEQSLRQIARVNGAVVGVTLGEKGSLFCHNDQLQAFPAALIVPVDTNGAGDVYHGAYAVALARGLPWVEAARYAGAAASLKCTRIHEWANLPSHEEVAAFMEKHPC
jgi:sulfofructose kinase